MQSQEREEFVVYKVVTVSYFTLDQSLNFYFGEGWELVQILESDIPNEVCLILRETI